MDTLSSIDKMVFDPYMSSSLVKEEQPNSMKNEDTISDDNDLLGLDAPPIQNNVTEQSKEQNIMDDINMLAAELTQGALELEQRKAMKLNDAYMALEQMRIANLEIELGHSIDHRRCVQCIRKPLDKRRITPYKLLEVSVKSHKPCLMCGSPTCSVHKDQVFRKSKVAICGECSPLFSLDFVLECIKMKNNADPEEVEKLKRHQIKHMFDVYDRVLLMLEYCTQFIDEVADQLENRSKKEDKIGATSNTAGVLSGISGVAAAACFVTPLGPPLLIASLLFGASAQMTSSGTKLVNYHSSPSKLAFKIISLYNLAKSILGVTIVLRDALLKDHVDLEKYVENMIKETEEQILEMETGYEKYDDENTTADFDDYDSDEDTACPTPKKNIGSKTTPRTPLEKIGKKEKALSPTGLALSSEGRLTEEDLINIDTPQDKSTNVDTQADAVKRDGVPLRKSSKTAELVGDDHFMERKDSNMGKLARFYSRSSLAGSSLISAAAVTVVAGAALSLFHVAFEANNLAATIKRIQAGSPSKRAQVLRMIKEDVKNLPETNVIIAEWEKYLDVMKERLHHQSRSEDEELESDVEEEPDQQHLDETKEPEDEKLESDGYDEPDQQPLDGIKEPIHTEESTGDDLD